MSRRYSEKSPGCKCGAGIIPRAGFLKKIIVAAHIRSHLTGVDMQNFRRQMPDEMHIVRDEHESALICAM